MSTFLIIFGIIILVIFTIGKSKSGTSLNSDRSSHSLSSKDENSQHEGLPLYKKKGIKSFEMKGMYYRDLIPEIHSGAFKGFAQCEDNSHDMYAVAVYNDRNELLGYTPKGNRRLNNSLRQWNQCEVPVWGSLFYDDYNDRWNGHVNIPVGLTNEQIQKLQSALSLMEANQDQIRKKEKSTVKYFEILTRHRQIVDLLSDLDNPSEINYSFPKNLLPTISSHLEREKNWDKLVELGQYQDLISQLNDKFREATLNRIKKAKQNVI
jgi:hypothetical protein